MAKYTKERLAEMAEEVLFAYNSGDQRADMLLMMLSNLTRVPVQHIITELHKMCQV